MGLVLNLQTVDVLLAFLVALSLSSLLNMLGLWLDTANPRLNWDNPIAAMKQNPNSIVMMLGSMGLMGGAGFLAFKAGLSLGSFALFFGLLPGIAFLVLLGTYPGFARKRLARMEV